MARVLTESYDCQQQGDGFRALPVGAPLALVIHREPGTTGRLRDQLWRKKLMALACGQRQKRQEKWNRPSRAAGQDANE